MRRRVVITGMGAISPLGNSVDELFGALAQGKSGIGPITLFNASRFPTKFAAEVRDFDLARYVRAPDLWAGAATHNRFAAAAAEQALADSGALDNGHVNRERFGVYLGTGEGTQDFHRLISIVARSYRPQERALDSTILAKTALRELTPQVEFEQELHRSPALIAAYFDLEGPNFNCLTACAAGGQAIGEATELIRHGDADLMLAGGSHSMIHPFGVTGFNLLTALSTNNGDWQRASRPFDLRRDGFVLGEGAGMLVLEELEHARSRGARVYAEVTGYGSTADAFRVTDSHPEGRGAIASMRDALTDSGLAASDIGYINAHGTSTQINDRVETVAIKQVFGDHAYQIPVSSTKSMLGHLIAAAGAVELIVCTQALRTGILPPTINYEVPDPECDLDYIPNVPRQLNVRHAMSNSFGFGGQNISLIVSKI
jgi:3-oxoacyl-[acyl-carrier-protein] synthase II